MLQNTVNWLANLRKTQMGTSVVYRRGNDSATVTATIGHTTFEVDSGYGVLEEYQSRDFLILAADLVLASQQVLPERGDRIRETVGEQTFVYEVLAPSGQQPWRYSDPYRTTLRIHTKHVTTE